MSAIPKPATLDVDPNTYNDAVRLFNRASAQIMCKPLTAFYSAMLFQMPVIWTTTVTKTAAVDTVCNLYLNPQFVNTLDVSQMIFLLAHELEHILGFHPQRLANRDPIAWNKAGDAVINANLRRAGIGTFIRGGIDNPDAWNKTPDELYDPTPPGEDGGEGGDDIGGTGHDIILGDGEGEGNPTPDQIREGESRAKQIIASAAQACRVAGTLSADMERRVNDILNVKTPWFEILERFMTERAQSDYSWQRPNRRFISQGIYLPSMLSTAAMGEVSIIRDVSGSIGPTEHDHVVGHLNAIFERCRPASVRVLDTSTRVHHVHEFTADDLPINPPIMGCGGTDLRSGFDYINANLDAPAVCIVFTDGHTPWPETRQDYPVIVLCTTDTEVNYGDEVVRYAPDL